MRTILRQMPRFKYVKKGMHTIEIGYPWLTFGAIVELERIVGSHFKVLEFGSGGSTVFFSRRCSFIKSIENNILWHEKVKAALVDSTNTELICTSPEESLKILAAEQDEYYDLILVDSDPSYGIRVKYWEGSVPKLKKGGYLVLDNYYHRNLRNTIDYSGFNVYTYDAMWQGGRGTRICIKL